MRTLFPWLFLLVCPLMMLFMMRGMQGGGHSTGPDAGHEPDRGRSGEPNAVTPTSGRDPQARISQLEREVAELRATRDGNTDDTSARFR